jgi:quercetin dioxygenase-like cupin family protein
MSVLRAISSHSTRQEIRDDRRALTVADPDDAGVPHISVAGGTYTVLVSGAQTAGRYCLVDMLVPADGGPPPHRHDFEEMFTLLEGELEFTFRGKSQTVRAGSTVNVPANAPHAFKNVRQDGPHALHVYAGGTGRILPGGRISRRRPHIATTKADLGRDGRERQTDRGAAAEISHRDGEDVRRAGRSRCLEWPLGAAPGKVVLSTIDGQKLTKAIALLLQ